MNDFRLSDHADTRVVILEDNRYVIAPLNRTRQLKVDALEEPTKGDSTDQFIAKTVALIDVFLLSENGSSSPADEYLSELWTTDRITVDQLVALLDYVQAAPDPPDPAPSGSTTSPGATSA